MWLFRKFCVLGCFCGWIVGVVLADEHAQHQHDDETPVQRPVVFLDKSPRIVEYQLKRLDNTRLLLVERASTSAKYIPVHEAILRRPGIAQQDREECIAALTQLKSVDAITVLLEAIGRLDAASNADRQVAVQLSRMLLEQPESLSTQMLPALQSAAGSGDALVSAAGFAALIRMGDADQVAGIAATNEATMVASMDAVGLLAADSLRNAQRNRVVTLLQKATAPAVREAAVRALSTTTDRMAESFEVVASLLDQPELRPAAVRALLKLLSPELERGQCRDVVAALVQHAESLAAADRTSDAFIDEMQLADALLGRLEPGDATAFRERLRAITVRIVRIRTILEEMRYDTPYFAVEAGRPVQVILQNDDLMPHNIVVTRPGKLQLVAEQGALLGPEGGPSGLPYVPDNADVLFAAPLVDAGKQQRLTFTAPTEPGEYPYVCTFPRHWMRMYGVMLVVPDLDAWLQNPVPPKDPLGNTRPFVKSWTLADLAESLSHPPAAKPEIGAQLFREATCWQCHKIDGSGGEVGPELGEVLTRWKGDRKAVLRQILEPSYRIEPKYTVQLVVTSEGRTISGIVKAEDETTLSLLENPEAKAPVVIRREDIDEIIPSTTSMMPKALLDKFTAEEIMQILNFICRTPAGMPNGELCR